MVKLLRMTATFGRLEQETLELQDGLNILTAPNEAGKSTWSAFLLAMLYGIDTSERSSKTNLPVKTKYKPWSGRPMAGRLELEYEGRRLTIERGSSGRVPFGQFSAYETESGLPCDFLTAENCGTVLIGAERSVFERSAFLGQNAIAVGPDSALERRLAALTSTGEETVSYSETAQRLRDWKNRCRHNKTGLLPQAEAALQETEDTLAEIRRLNQDSMALRTEAQRLSAGQAAQEALLRRLDAARALAETEGALQAAAALEGELAQTEAAAEKLRGVRDALQGICRSLDAEEQNARFQTLSEARQRLAEAESAAARLQTQTAGLPDGETLRALSLEWDSAAAAQSAIPASAGPAPLPPELPEAYRGCPEAEIRRRAGEDVRRLDEFSAAPKRQMLFLPAAILLVLAVVGLIFSPALGAVLAALGLALLLVALTQRRREKAAAAQRAQEAAALLARCGAADRDDLLTRAAEAAAAVAAWEQAKTRQAQAEASLQTQRDAAAARTQAVLAKIAAFSGTAPANPAAFLQAARESVAACGDAQRQAQQQRQSLSRLQEAFGTPEKTELPADWVPGRYDRAVLQRKLAEADQELAALVSRRDRLHGRLAAIEGRETLEARRAEQTESLRALGGPAPCTRAEAEQQLAETRRRLAETETRLHEQRGLVSGKGDPAALEAQREALQGRIRALTGEFDALTEAAEALDAANAQMQSRFAPQLSREAASLLGALTGGRYQRVLLDRELSFRAQEEGAAEAHPLSYLSCGTADQLYLAVRLALCRLTLPEGAPLVLDDALVNFDDRRAAEALRLLLRESETRQILLFTCHSREKDLLSGLKNEP